MAWNGPVNGDYSNCDFTKGPWAGGIMELTHEEVLFVIENAAQFVEGHEHDDFYVTSQYNIFVQWEEAINQETYACIKGYDPQINQLGINAQGIIVPEPEPEPVVEESTPEDEEFIGEEIPVEVPPIEEEVVLNEEVVEEE